MFNNADTLEKCKHGSGHRRYTWSNLGWPSTIRDYLSGGEVRKLITGWQQCQNWYACVRERR